jgi:DNA glycosylase AlkZ-like
LSAEPDAVASLSSEWEGPGLSVTVTREQAVAYRLQTNDLVDRLPPGSYAVAARYAIQDSGPRDGLISLHARVSACEPWAWEAPGLAQFYSPRAAVHIVPVTDIGVFTVGRLPRDADARREIEETAENICRILDGQERRQADLPGLRWCAPSGRIALRWTTSALYVREIARPDVDPEEARIELCRRHLHAFGPTTPAAFAWWAGVPIDDARATWQALDDHLVAVKVDHTDGWLLADDVEALLSAPPATGTRFLPAGDLRILGQDRTGTFVGPGQRRRPPRTDWFHPHGLLHDGQLIGAWGRRGGHVHVRLPEPPTLDLRSAAEAEASAMPIPGYPTDLTFDVA